jgi:ATP-dependent DNA ligase
MRTVTHRSFDRPAPLGRLRWRVAPTARTAASRHFAAMVTLRIRTDGFIDPCIPTRAAKPPVGPAWVHEVKHDGYRLIVRREGPTVRLFTRGGYDWTGRYPAIAAAAAKLRARSSRDWIKVKNPDCPAMIRAREHFARLGQ